MGERENEWGRKEGERKGRGRGWRGERKREREGGEERERERERERDGGRKYNNVRNSHQSCLLSEAGDS